jgi:uncharacterized membrane protein
MSKARLEAYSDGVFGVAITLLILDVRAEEGSTGWQMLTHEWHPILVFLLSFVLVGVYWVAHHHIMHFITGVNRTLLWLNLSLLLFIVFIPYVATLLSANHADPSSIRIYASTLILVNLTMTGLGMYAGKEHRLVHAALPKSFATFMLRLQAVPILAYGIAIALASCCRWISLLIFVLVPAFFILPNPFLEKRLGHAMEMMREHEKKREE